MIPQLRIQLMKDMAKAKTIRNITKEIDNKKSFEIIMQKEKLDKKIDFYENFIKEYKKIK